jgi:hypothetical protein
VAYLSQNECWAGGYYGTLLHYGLPQPASTPERPAAVADFSLGPNFPNPFNPTTTIRFSLPRAQHISLHIFDVLGRRLDTIAEGMAAPGDHAVTWSCPQCASGMYFARLSAGGQFRQQKMLLLK